MIMSLGPFVFDYRGTPLQTWQRDDSTDWASNKRIGQRPAHQFIGQGETSLTLNGALYPEHTSGSALSLDALRAMKNRDSKWILIGGTGRPIGTFVINSINETYSNLHDTGHPRKIEFSLKLTRTDNHLSVDNFINDFSESLGF